jgi:hypothetical protein
MAQRNVHFVGSSGFYIPWERQIPGGGSVWKNTRYVAEPLANQVLDWLVVYETWPEGVLQTRVPIERRILVCAEPQSFHRYQKRFLAQFGHVITTQRGTGHPGVMYQQPAISWFVGVRFGAPGEANEFPLKFEDFLAGNPPKTKLCSVVCSNKTVTKGHRQRLAFVKQLQREFGSEIDVFGRGFNEIRDKDEALAAYRFHIAIENSCSEDYWTEKLADPFLRGCFPIYAGCPNLESYFPSDSYEPIDLNRPKQAIEKIRQVLNSLIDLNRTEALNEAKRRVLWEHNALAMLERTYEALEGSMTTPKLLPVAEQLLTDDQYKDLKFSRRLRRALKW